MMDYNEEIRKNLPECDRTDCFFRIGDEKALTEYAGCVSDLLQNETVQRMREFLQHGEITCLDHCLYVSYRSFILCRKMGLNSRSAARGGLLHDLFLYDWHTGNDGRGLHAFTHPKAALKNADRQFTLNGRERDIILKHMWPLTPALPRYPESYVVLMFDKYCAVMETLHALFGSRRRKTSELAEKA